MNRMPEGTQELEVCFRCIVGPETDFFTAVELIEVLSNVINPEPSAATPVSGIKKARINKGKMVKVSEKPLELKMRERQILEQVWKSRGLPLPLKFPMSWKNWQAYQDAADSAAIDEGRLWSVITKNADEVARYKTAIRKTRIAISDKFVTAFGDGQLIVLDAVTKMQLPPATGPDMQDEVQALDGSELVHFSDAVKFARSLRIHMVKSSESQELSMRSANKQSECIALMARLITKTDCAKPHEAAVTVQQCFEQAGYGNVVDRETLAEYIKTGAARLKRVL